MKNITQSLKIIVLATVLSFGMSYALAWTSPTALPPGGNVPSPLNVSGTDQYKGDPVAHTGGLGVEGLIRGYSNAIIDGILSAATTTTKAVVFGDGTTQTTATAAPHGKQLFTATTTTSWTAPAGVTTVWVTGAGASGGGGGAYYANVSTCNGGGLSGLSYGTLSQQVSVTPSTAYAITVGSGGTVGVSGASPTDGGIGGSSKIVSPSNVTILTLAGGGGGTKGTSSGPGTSGVAGGTYTRAGGYAFGSASVSGGGCVAVQNVGYVSSYNGTVGFPGFMLIEW